MSCFNISNKIPMESKNLFESFSKLQIKIPARKGDYRKTKVSLEVLKSHIYLKLKETLAKYTC